MAFYENTIVAKQDLAEKELKDIVNYLESKVKTHHTIFTNYELSFIKRRTSR